MLQDVLPSKMYLDGTECQLMVDNNLNAPIPGQGGSAQAEASTQPIKALNGQLYGIDGLPLTIKGINWFGFETSSTVMQGLWQGPTALTQDYQYVAYRIKLMGFNTIRLPFSFQACCWPCLCGTKNSTEKHACMDAVRASNNALKRRMVGGCW